jgi:drug/metabolite transporter (DMT)-like permease
VRTANTIQLAAAFIISLPFALMETEAMRWQNASGAWNTELIGAMAWSVLVLTLGGSSLLYLLIQRGAATAVTSLLYLVPPTTALMAWVLFREPITVITLIGTAITAAGVYLVIKLPHASRR